MIVLDASVLIGQLDPRDALHERASELLVETGHRPLGASTVTLAEVLVTPTRRGRLDAARDALRTLGVHEMPLPTDAAVRLATLRAQTRRPLPDCCVVLAAQHPAAEGLVTLDDRLAAAARHLGLAVR